MDVHKGLKRMYLLCATHTLGALSAQIPTFRVWCFLFEVWVFGSKAGIESGGRRIYSGGLRIVTGCLTIEPAILRI